MCISFILSVNVRANTVGWFSSDITVGQQDDSAYSLSIRGLDCKLRDDVPIKGIGPTAACVSQGTRLKFAHTANGTFIAKGYDQTFYPLDIPGDRYVTLSPNTDRVVMYRNVSSYAGTFAVYENASSRLVYSDGLYVLQASQPTFQYSQSPHLLTFPRISSDGHFAAYVGTGSGETKLAVKMVNLATNTTTTVGYILDTEAYSQESYRDIAISDDGEYVTINTYARSEGSNNFFRTVQVWRNKNCDVEASMACETRLVTENVPHIAIPSGLEFNDTATNVTMMSYEVLPVSNSYNYYRTTFSIPDLFRDRQLGYLAMGDSYSSGEGVETGMGNHYLKGTDILGDVMTPSETCHVSDRSYPFLLHKWLMADATMRSIACSGAVVAHDYTGSERGYKGQGSRLARLSDVMVSQVKRDALDISFIPGRNKQISFVKKYQPKAVTITGGGNDVGFAKIITKCADPADTCTDATSPLKISKLGGTIRAQYDTLTQLYKTIHNKSPKTKIYAVGYPQFVSGRDVTCAANVGLDTTERRLVREGTIMMNDVIEAAANAAGVKYVDIESSLGDAVLCGEAKTEYVNGITFNSTWGQLGNRDFFSNESFHPDSMGHYVMARAIQAALGGKSPVEYSYCHGSATVCPKNSPVPPLTDFFKIINTAPLQWIGESFAQTLLQPLVNSTLRVSAVGLGKGSATVRMESTPRTLGVVEISEDGVLDADLTVPRDVEPGIHTLYIDALSPAGEQITLWQHITILGLDGDLDGNGVNDTLQPCPFVVGDVQDSDNDGIDDRCDPKIGSEVPMEVSPPIQQDDGDAPVSSSFTSVAVKKLLQSRPHHTTDNIPGYRDKDGETMSLRQNSVSEQPPYGGVSARVLERETPQPKNSFPLINVSIIIFVIVCIVTLTGFVYAKTRRKKP